MFKIKKYKGFEIHYTFGTFKYDVYHDHGGHKHWLGSSNSLREIKRSINNTLKEIKQ